MIISGGYVLEFTKETGRIVIKDRDQNVVVSEPLKEGRMLTEFDSYRNVFQNEKQAQMHASVDGIRADSDEFTRVFHKKLYKCKVQFDFADNEAIYGFGSHEEGFGNFSVYSIRHCLPLCKNFQ